jgi:4-amino-4-deoxy-L-arabinose transferase-like glycosyltransferase
MLVFRNAAASGEYARVTQRITRKHLLVFLTLLVTAFSVRILTLQFMRSHLHDPSWFQTGSYAKFDKQARDILSGSQDLFWIQDPSRTDLAQYPPAFVWLVAIVYKLTGDYSAYSVQLVTWCIDSFVSLLLVTVIAVTAFGWRVGVAASFLAALSPLLAMYGAYPSADAPAAWFVLAANWALLVAAKRRSSWFALAAGLFLGVACWFRVNPLYLAPAWAFALGVLVKATWQTRLRMSAAVFFGTAIVIAPIVVRNYLSFPDFTPTGGTIGTNLWEGLGETELGRKNGFLFGDEKMIEVERVRMGLPADFPIEAQWPDGIRRDRERVRTSLDFIKQHPVWYAGVMLKRMWGMLKVAGEPLPYYASSGINVTSQKCLPPQWQGGLLAVAVKILGMVQSVVRYLFLPLVVPGIYLASRWNLSATGLLGVTILYYLIPGTAAHPEFRYMLPMHSLLSVFAGFGVSWLLSRGEWHNKNSWRGFGRTNGFGA